MEHFVLFPTYDIIKKYDSSIEPEEQFLQMNKDGCYLQVAAYREGADGELYFSSKHIKTVEKEFRSLLKSLQLQDHYDNLLYLIIKKRNYFDDVLIWRHDHFPAEVRISQMANFYHAFNANGEPFNSIQFKSGKKAVTIKDKTLINWINGLIKESVEKRTYPNGIFGFTNLSILSVEQLAKLSDSPLPKNRDIKYQGILVEFYYYIEPYLLGETSIKKDPNKRFEDKILKFVFEIFVLFRMIDPSEIISLPQDYMDTLLRNHDRRVNIFKSAK